MQPIRPTVLTLLSLALIGCQSQPEKPVQGSNYIEGRCNASAVQRLVGEKASPELLDQARDQSGATVARILRPGDIVTLEYNDQRLTLSTDETLKIQRIGCG
jgi:hypothetical protein